MKISLAFDVFNKAATIEGVLRSWLDMLSGKHKVEAIIVYDALVDRSNEVVAQVSLNYPHVSFYARYTNDVFEIKANNAALEWATGDVVVFIQDDNLMHDAHWDDTLARVMNSTPNVGAVGLLSGVRVNKDFSYNRIECFRPHKHEGAWVHGIAKDAFPLAVYSVDFINRPFAISVPLLREYGGLDEAYCPMDWDDADLSFKLLRDDFTNLYVPFDLVNTSAKQQTLSGAQMSANYQHGEAIARARWGKFVAARATSVRQLMPMTATGEGLVLG